MKLSSRDFTSCNVLWRWFCFNRKCGIGGGHEVGGCTWRVQTAWSSLGSALETPWLALGRSLLSVLLYMNGLRKQSCHLAQRPFLVGKLFFPVWVSSYWQSGMTTMGSLVGGCALSQKCVEDCCKSTCTPAQTSVCPIPWPSPAHWHNPISRPVHI